MVNDPTQDAGSVQTINKDGEAPKRRMASPAAAWSAYSTIRWANQRRDLRFGELQGIYNGMAPTPPGVNAANGMPDMPNINTRQFQAKVGTYVATWNAVTMSGQMWAEVEADNADPMIAKRNSEYLSECFNWAIQQWEMDGDKDDPDFCSSSNYVLNSSTRDTQMGIFGIGFSMFEDHIDFRWRPIPTRRILVPQGTRLTLDNCPALFIKDSISVSKLYSMRNKPGWNKDAICRALYDRVELSNVTSLTILDLRRVYKPASQQRLMAPV